MDDRKLHRIRLESEAIQLILAEIQASRMELAISEVLAVENNQNPEQWKRDRVGEFMSLCSIDVPMDNALKKRASELEGLSFRAYDALHVASAEIGKAKDDRLLKKARRNAAKIKVDVSNPVDWFRNLNNG